MESWILRTKLLIVLFCIISYLSKGGSDIPYVLLLILIYIIATMLFHILNRQTLRKSILYLICALLTFSSYYLDPLFAFLLPLNLLEIFNYHGLNKILALIPISLPIFFLDHTLIPEYLLISASSLIVFTLSFETFDRIAGLKNENDILREKIETLYGRLDASAEHEEQIKYLSQLEERNSVAQKIHDRIGHVLAGSLIQLEAALVVLDKDRENSRELIGNVIVVLKEGMENIRSTLRNIKPAPEQLGINRLKGLLNDFSLKHRIKTLLSYKGSLDRITHLQWRVILDNTREALTNTLKYGAAQQVNVKIEVLNKLIRMEIVDDGKGAASIKKSLGLRGIEERTENLGGKVILDGSNGFSVITLLPLGEISDDHKSFDCG